MSTLDDFRFLRLTWEVEPSARWSWYARGESRRDFVDNSKYFLNWGDTGYELKVYVEGKVGSASRKIQSETHYWRPGMTWVRRTSKLCMRALPAGFVFSGGAQAAFPIGAEAGGRLAALALTNSTVFDALIKVSVGRTGDAVQFESGMIDRTPWPMDKGLPVVLADLALRAWQLQRQLLQVESASIYFRLPAVLQSAGRSFSRRVESWSAWIAEVEAEQASVQFEIDELCFELYGISDEDRVAITEGFGVTEDDESGDDGAEAEDADELVGTDPTGLAAGLVSWAAGVAVGRFDVRLATGDREWPVEPDPFDPLPVCSPAMLTGEDGLPLVEPPDGYPVEVSPVLVDDPGHRLDITTRVRSVFDVAFGADADDWWTDIGDALGAKGGEVGAWLSKGFFEHHLEEHRVPKSRKAPILWPIGTTSGSYVVWLYAHRATADSLFQVLNDLVDPKLSVEQRRLVELTQEAGPNPSASQRKAIDAQEKLVGELQELRSQLETVAPLWAPDLNDGIVIVLAPLWQLFAHHRAWSTELRRHWDRLSAGDYDWSQLAMHLWPERVIPKCAEDRSLAIAHGLEDVFWVQDDDKDDKWHPRTTPTTPIDQLITNRHNPTTTAALQQATT